MILKGRIECLACPRSEAVHDVAKSKERRVVMY